MNIEKAIDAIKQELDSATEKFPLWPTCPIHASAVVAEESGELVQACLHSVYEPDKSNLDDARKEAIQTAAMAIRFIVSADSDLYELETNQQHEQENG